MFWILLVMAVFVSVLLSLLVGGLATPRAHVAARAITVRAAPERVWELIRDVDHYPEWRPDVRRVERVVEDDGRFRWREFARHGSVTYEATQDEPPHRFGSRIVDEDLPYSGEWRWELTPAGAGTRLVITERGDVRNLVFRFLGAHVIGHTRTIDAYLSHVAGKLGESATPEAAER